MAIQKDVCDELYKALANMKGDFICKIIPISINKRALKFAWQLGSKYPTISLAGSTHFVFLTRWDIIVILKMRLLHDTAKI